MIIISLVFFAGFLECIARLHSIVFVRYLSFGKAFVTNSTLELLIMNLILFDIKFSHIANNFLCCSILKPSKLYPTNEVFFSGAYGGSKYAKSPDLILSNDFSNPKHLNSTFLINSLISSSVFLSIIFEFL